jgi:hypothetical protein
MTTPERPAPPAEPPRKPRPKSVPKEAPGLENHPTANPNYRGRDPRSPSAPTGKPGA